MRGKAEFQLFSKCTCFHVEFLERMQLLWTTPERPYRKDGKYRVLTESRVSPSHDECPRHGQGCECPRAESFSLVGAEHTHTHTHTGPAVLPWDGTADVALGSSGQHWRAGGPWVPWSSAPTLLCLSAACPQPPGAFILFLASMKSAPWMDQPCLSMRSLRQATTQQFHRTHRLPSGT